MILFILVAVQVVQTEQRINYPETRREHVVDQYHGVEVQDPYRWLEEDVRKSEEVAAWVTAENEITSAYIKSIPVHDTIEKRLTEVWNYPKHGSPVHYGQRWFQTRNTGLQNHSVVYTGNSPTSIDTVLLDPNTWSEDGTVALSMWRPSDQGSFLAWGISEAGSDWSTWKIKNISTGVEFPEVLTHIKNTSPAWVPTEVGFYYTRYPNEGSSEDHINTTDGSELWFHFVGTPQGSDQLVYSDLENPQRFYGPRVTEDGRWLVVSVNNGTSADNGVLVFPTPDFKPQWLVPTFDASMEFIGSQGDVLYFKTDRDAPRGKVIRVDLSFEKLGWEDVIPQQEDILRSADVVGNRITALWLQDASSSATVHDLEGTRLYEVAMPSIGTARGFGGWNTDTSVFWSFNSFNFPPTIFNLDLVTMESNKFWTTNVPIDLSDLAVTRVFVTSTDGNRIPMFITSKSGAPLTGNCPVLLYGYGGFDISILPYFSASRAAWIEMGGVYAVACIRGGSEYGRKWHEGGMLANKQQVFDDFIACGEWLIDNNWTNSDKLAIQGGSNGGLLVGACMTQRPDLFGACLPAVGVMDMLRFPLFTVGWAWTSDYGSPDDPEMFPILFGYSPYHNIRQGTVYPPTLVTTGDTDDRVVPGHSFKFAAALQHAQRGDNPVLIRIETRAGHGAGKPTQLRIEEAADVYSFLYESLGM